MLVRAGIWTLPELDICIKCGEKWSQAKEEKGALRISACISPTGIINVVDIRSNTQCLLDIIGLGILFRVM